MMRTPPVRGTRGFTLIELMVAIAIVGLLLAVALPSYRNSVLKSRRTDAKTALFDLAARQQQYYTTHNAYTATLTQLGYPSASEVPVTNSGVTSYTLTVQVPDPDSANAVSFRATATPSGDQSSDPCGSYVLSSVGSQSNGGSASGCW